MDGPLVAVKLFASRRGILLYKGSIRLDCHSGTSNRIAAVRVAGEPVANSLAQCKQEEIAALLSQVDKHNKGMGSRGMGHKGSPYKIPYEYAHAHDQPMPFRLLIIASMWHLECKLA